MKRSRPFAARPATLAGTAFVLSFLGSSPGAVGQEDLTSKVLELFERSCRECHHPDTEAELPDLHGEIDVADLLENPDDYLTLVPLVPGDAEKSGVVHRSMLPLESRKRMPKSSGAEGDKGFRAPLTDGEKKLLTDWAVGFKAGEPEKVVPEKVAEAGAEKTGPKTAEDLPEPKPETVEAGSAEPAALPEGTSEEEKVRFILKENCVTCHYPDHDYPDLSATVNLNLLLKKDSGGVSVADKILDRVTRAADDQDRMPRSAGKPGGAKYVDPLGEEEIGILKAWAGGARKEVAKREPIPMAEMVARIHADVVEGGQEARHFRYLTLTHLYSAAEPDGAPQVDDDTMDSHRAGLGKLMNSLSGHGRITFPEAVDEEGTIFRIDLRDYRWTAEDWEEVTGFYPHGIVGVDGQKEKIIARETGSEMAYVRGDWFVFACAQPPLYHEILSRILDMEEEGAEGYLGRLDKRLGVDREENLKRGDAVRAGFHRSGVSSANRLIERHELGDHRGAYWISYDFKLRGGGSRANLFRAPMGPAEALMTDNEEHIFDHDGGEVIFNLPNGLQAYVLATAEGDRLDRAPVDIVQDDQHHEKAIINGISCIRCHDQGMKAAIDVVVPPGWDEAAQGPKPNTLAGMMDEMRAEVLGAGILDFKERALFERIHPEDPEVLRRAVLGDFERFAEAEKAATGGKRGALEPIGGLYEEYLRMVDADRLSAELGMGRKEVLGMLGEEKGKSESLAVLYNWLEKGNAERRETLLQDYLTLVYALGFELMPFEPLGYEEFGGQEFADLIRESDAFVLAFGKEGKSGVRKEREEAKEAVVDSVGARKGLTQDRVLLPGGGQLEVSIQPKLVVGDKAELVVVASEDVHVRIVHLSADEFVTELYPGTTGKETLLEKGRERVVTWETTEPGGPENVIVFASKRPIDVKDLKGAEKVGEFVVYKREDYFTTRGVPKNIVAVDVEAKDGEGRGKAVPAGIVEAKVGYFLKE